METQGISSEYLERMYKKQNEKLLNLQEVANKGVSSLISALTFYTAVFTISAYWFHMQLQCKLFALVVVMVASTFSCTTAHFYLYYQEINDISIEVASVKHNLMELVGLASFLVSTYSTEREKHNMLRRRIECSLQASKLFRQKYCLILLAVIVATLIFASSFPFAVYQVICNKKEWN